MDARRRFGTRNGELFVQISPVDSSDEFLSLRERATIGGARGACARKMKALSSRRKMKGARVRESEPLLTAALLFIEP